LEKEENPTKKLIAD